MRTRSLTVSIAVVLVLCASTSLLADRVRLRSGQVVNGSFMSADVLIVRILLDSGKIAEFAVEDVSAVEFSPRKPAGSSTSGAAANAPTRIVVPAGTVLGVILSQTIDVSAVQSGLNVRGLVDSPVMVEGKVVIPRNAAVTVQARTQGANTLSLNAHTISFDGRKYTIATAFVEHKLLAEGAKAPMTIVPAETRLRFPLTTALVVQP
jgi:hypothetical protein